MSSAVPVLSIANLEVSIASVRILRGVSLELPAGSMTGLIGRNGAGKTTLMKTIMGILKRSNGAIAFESRELLEVPTHARVRLGMRRRRRGQRDRRKAAVNRPRPTVRHRGGVSSQRPSQERMRNARTMAIGSQSRGQASSHQRDQRA